MANLIAAAFPTNPIVAAATLLELCRSHRLYAIFITPRSGSTWRTEMAFVRGQRGMPQEWFNKTFLQTNHEFHGCRPPRLVGTSDINEYIRSTIARHRSPADVMDCSCRSTRHNLCSSLSRPRRWQGLMTFFYLRRRNLVGQAVSLYRSVASGRFHSYETDREALARFGAVSCDAIEIAHWLGHLAELELGFEAMFQNCWLGVRRFFCEDMVAGPGQTLHWMHAIIGGGGWTSGARVSSASPRSGAAARRCDQSRVGDTFS